MHNLEQHRDWRKNTYPYNVNLNKFDGSEKAFMVAFVVCSEHSMRHPQANTHRSLQISLVLSSIIFVHSVQRLCRVTGW